MSDDTKALVERLRRLARGLMTPSLSGDTGLVMCQAADTIERLARELAEARRNANPCRASVDVVQTFPVPDDALPFMCCCCRQTHYLAPVNSKATPLRRPMSQGGGIVYDHGALAERCEKLREALRMRVIVHGEFMDGEHTLEVCDLCGGGWKRGNSERHAKGCLAVPKDAP